MRLKNQFKIVFKLYFEILLTKLIYNDIKYNYLNIIKVVDHELYFEN